MMFKLSRVFFCALVAAVAITGVSVSDVAASTRNAVKELVVEEARRAGLRPSLALAVAKVESDFQPHVLSSAGARGVMQIMPATARGEYGMPADKLWDARTNVRLGVDFLGKLIKQYNGRWDLALSHYNGGTIKNGRPHSYTRDYVRKVLNWEKRYAQQHDVWIASNTPRPKVTPKVREDWFETLLADGQMDDYYEKFKRDRERKLAAARLKDELARRDSFDAPGQSKPRFQRLPAPRVVAYRERMVIKPLRPIVRWSN